MRAAAGRTPQSPTAQAALRALARRRPEETARLARQLIARDDRDAEGWMLLARAHQQQSAFPAMADCAERALMLAPGRAELRLLAVEARLANGDVADALTALREEAGRRDTSASTLQQLTILFTQLSRHGDAYACSARFLEASGASLSARYARASAAVAVGELDEARQILDAIIDDGKDSAEARYSLATLRKATREDQQIDAITKALSRLPADAPDRVPLYYALGKEQEDLGEHGAAFDAFSQGAAARRSRLPYRVEGDVETLAQLARIFDEGWWSRTAEGSETGAPLFILGLPRSGSTLVDRMLSSLPGVASLGEVNDLTYAVLRAGESAGGDRQRLMTALAGSDLGGLGHAYWQALCGYGEAAPRLIDKTPNNFLYLGLIAKALPAASLVHVHRHPMASCFALFKSLFRMGYPYSYDFDSLAAYYAAYDRLMTHWRRLLGDRLVDLSYEALVDQPETESRRLAQACGLRWQPESLAFHRNRAPTATASAVQVRQPLYRSARDLWREHETALAPLADALDAHGVTL